MKNSHNGALALPAGHRKDKFRFDLAGDAFKLTMKQSKRPISKSTENVQSN